MRSLLLAVLCAACGASAPPPRAPVAEAAPPEEAAPEPETMPGAAVVSMNLLEGSMIAGEKFIHLPPEILQRAAKSGNRSMIALVKLCLGVDGAPSLIQLKRSSGREDVDAFMLARMAEWRFTPYQLDGKPVRVCTAKIFRWILH